MADHVPQELNENASTETSEASPQLQSSAAETAEQPDAEPAALPERIRVHALAKMLGVTSKRILSQLVELGSSARSPHSNLNREVAEAVRDSIADTSPQGGEPPAAPLVSPASAADEPVVVVESEPEAKAAPAASAAQVPSLFTHQVRVEPVHAPQFSAVEVAAPLFLQPDAEAAKVSRRRKRTRNAEADVESAPLTGVEPEEQVSEAAASTADEAADTTDESGEPSRRRRRGRRGRGRGRGEQAGAENESEQADDTAEPLAADAESGDLEDSAEDAGADEADEVSEGGSSRRRRRRRRRKVSGDAAGESDASEDDPPNTVVHEREPRSKSRKDEVQGISGSTRLEAKRQRRRDGRDVGRRRPPILTESEFLARREAVDRVMVVREKVFADDAHATTGLTTTQVAVLEDNILVEHFVTSTGSASMVGNIYLGRVQNVLPSMEAAFVDIGRGRNGVLYAGEVNWEAAGLGGKERKIEQALKPGDQVLVQVSKDPVGHKGARLTTQISLAGRFLVYVPNGSSTGISRKLPDTERKRLKEILRDIVPADAGVIIRTASEGVSAEELARDVERLQAAWRAIESEANEAKDSASHGKGVQPHTLYEEPDLLVKVVRDLFNEDFSKLVIEGDTAWKTVENYIKTVAPDLLARVAKHENTGTDIFTVHRIDEQLAKALDRKVWLPSGGTLVIDRTEAMTVIDVNTGKFTGSGGNLEETVTRNNLEAAEEIVRQMRLRDIGGMIVVDFIDMVLESNRDLVLRRLTESLGRDRTRHQVSEVTSLGLVQMTRKKLGTGLVEAFSSTCEHCNGRGIIVHEYPVDVAAPTEDTGTKAATREGGSRRRRGRDRAAAQAEPVTNGATAEHSEVDASVKRAHPVALAMAAHHHEDEADDIESVDLAQADTAVETIAEPEVAAEPEVVAEAVAAAEGDAVAVAEPVVESRVEPVVAAPAVTVEPEPEIVEPTPEPAPKRPAGRRRVSRATSAPAGEDEGKVFVISSTEQTAPAFTLPEPVLPPRQPRRRRTAARPAGAPEGE